MPKITIKYEHSHELTDLLGKLAQIYVVPEATCGVDVPYPENYNQGDSESVLEAKLKGIEATTKYRDVLNQIHNLIIERGLLKDVSFEDGIKDFPLLISCIFRENREMRNSLRQLGVPIYTKDNTAFIADTDNQLFTLEEAAEYLEINKFNVFSLMNDGDLKCQGFLLSDLRKVKKSWEDSV